MLPLRLLVAGLLALAADAQHDLRDTITRKDGKAIRGRVIVPSAPNELLVLQGGARMRVPRSAVASLDLVGDRVREFFLRRLKFGDKVRGQWFLVDWAERHELPGLARAQALLLALDADLEEAHLYLGHRKRRDEWLWRFRDRLLKRRQFDERLSEKGLLLRGERFAVHCRGDLRAAVAALLDLERLGVAWYDEFGTDLALRETLEPIRVDLHRDSGDFPKWGFRPVPYYTPPPHGDSGHTYLAGVGPRRPEKLIFVGTEGLLYRSLIGESNLQSNRDRICAWLEIGLGMRMENRFRGRPGLMHPGTPRSGERLAQLALAGRSRLSSLLHVPMYGGYYLTDDSATATHWASATMLTEWLLEPDNAPPTRDAFLRYIREALGEKKGDSSTLFDEVMGRRIEEMEGPWRLWLEQQTRD